MFAEIYSFPTYKYVRAITVFKFLLWVEEGVPWLRWFVDILLKLWPGLILISFQVGFVVEVALPSYTVNYTHVQRVRICCHSTNHVHINGHDRTILVIFSQVLYKTP